MVPTNILLVDDLADKLLVYRTVLENPELNIITARSGAEALRQVLVHEFAVILMDVNMPGMDGFETAQLIRKRRRSASTPIIFLTAFTDEMRISQGYASGAVDYIPTPVVPGILRAKVQVFVDLFRMRRQSAEQAEENAKHALAKEAAQRSTFLAQAGAALTRSLDLRSLLDTTVRIPIPFLADLCVLYTGETDREVTFRSASPSTTSVEGTDIVRGDCPFPWLGKVLERAALGQEERIIGNAPFTSTPKGSGFPFVGGGQVVVLPIATRHGMQASIAMLRTTERSHFSTAEFTLARELVARVGIALENVMLVHGIQEADRRKDEFLGMLAHELRNPLAPLRNAVDMLETVNTVDPMLISAREIIDRQVGHMTRLVDDLLDATRIARGKVLMRKEPCDLCNVVRRTVADYSSLFASGKVQILVDVPEGPHYIFGDPTRLSQMVGNLLHNARKFTDAGGTVTVRLVVQDDAWARIEVQDTGVGIDAAVLPHIFEVFRQAEQGLDRSRGGLGLGLTLVKGFAELHEGSVEVQSGLTGGGTLFTVRLPLLKEVPIEVPNGSPRATVTAARRILVIDDNQDAADTIRLLLQRGGHEVRTAYTGPTGLESVKDFHPQVIICDIGLPGMDGYLVARAVREVYGDEPVQLIALTGYGRVEDRARAQEAGFDLHMTKPIDLKALDEALAMNGAMSGVGKEMQA